MTIKSEQFESHFDSDALIKTRLTELAAVFNRKLKSEAVGVYQDALHGYPYDVLELAFKKALHICERFPTPRTMRSLANEHMSARMNEPVLVCDLCRPDGWKLVPKPMPPAVYYLIGPNNKPTGEIRTVPYKMAIRCNHFGQRTYFDDEEVFRAEDCEEGREFLATLKRVAEEKKIDSSKVIPSSDPTWQDNWHIDDAAYLEQLRILADEVAEAKAKGIDIPLSPQEREALWLLKPLAVRKRFARMKARKELLDE